MRSNGVHWDSVAAIQRGPRTVARLSFHNFSSPLHPSARSCIMKSLTNFGQAFPGRREGRGSHGIGYRSGFDRGPVGGLHQDHRQRGCGRLQHRCHRPVATCRLGGKAQTVYAAAGRNGPAAPWPRQRLLTPLPLGERGWRRAEAVAGPRGTAVSNVMPVDRSAGAMYSWSAADDGVRRIAWGKAMYGFPCYEVDYRIRIQERSPSHDGNNGHLDSWRSGTGRRQRGGVHGYR